MIKYVPFSMFDVFEDPKIQTIVNTVNCVGVMGKGLALECKIRYPEMFEDYKKKCERQEVKIGQPYLYKAPEKWILNFPTKFHWKYPSKIDYIEKGLKYFVDHYKEWQIKSIAFPRLGCNEGKLDWEKIKILMEKYLSKLNDTEIYIYLDQESSQKEKEILKLLNVEDVKEIKNQTNLSEKQIQLIKNYIKAKGELTRVRDLLKIKGVGVKTYQKIIKSEILNNKNTQKKLFI